MITKVEWESLEKPAWLHRPVLGKEMEILVNLWLVKRMELSSKEWEKIQLKISVQQLKAVLWRLPFRGSWANRRFAIGLLSSLFSPRFLGNAFRSCYAYQKEKGSQRTDPDSERLPRIIFHVPRVIGSFHMGDMPVWNLNIFFVFFIEFSNRDFLWRNVYFFVFQIRKIW